MAGFKQLVQPLMKVRDVHRVIREGIIKNPCLLLKESDAEEWSRRVCQETVPFVRSRFPEANA